MKNLVALCTKMLLVLLPLIIIGCQQQPAPSPPATVPTTAPTTGKVLYSDDFNDEASGWDTYEDEDGSAFYYDGEFHIIASIYAEYNVVSYYIRETFTDFVLEVETKLVDGTEDNSHQVSVRTQHTEAQNGYMFVISADGYYAIGKYIDGEPIDLVPITRSIHIIKGKDAINLMRIECVGNNLRLSVNGHLLAEVTDSEFSGGYLGLGGCAWTKQDGKTFSEFTFDNIVVTAP